MTDDLLTAAGLSWRYVGLGQENLTYDLDREIMADYAELYTEGGELLVSMKRVPEMKTPRGAMPAFWTPHHSELLDSAAMDRIPTVAAIAELDVRQLLDIELDSAAKGRS